MAERGPGADSECLSQRGGRPSIFPLLWEVAGDIPKLLGTSQSCSVQVHMVTIALYLNPRQGEQGCAPTVGDRPAAQLWGAVAIGSSGDRRRVL